MEKGLIVVPGNHAPLPTVYPVIDPKAMIARGTEIANVLMDVVTKRGLSKEFNGKKHLMFEAWAIICAFEGIDIKEVSTTEKENGDYEATVELVDHRSGAVVGRGSSMCGGDEPNWRNKNRYARRSFAVTRAAGKACRLKYGWIAALAGYEATPEEEVRDLEEGHSSKDGGSKSSKPANSRASNTQAANKSGNGGGKASAKPPYNPDDPVMADTLGAELSRRQVDPKHHLAISQLMRGKNSADLQGVIDHILDIETTF